MARPRPSRERRGGVDMKRGFGIAPGPFLHAALPNRTFELAPHPALHKPRRASMVLNLPMARAKGSSTPLGQRNDPSVLGWRRLPPWCGVRPMADLERTSIAMPSASWGKWVLARMIAALVLLVVAVIALGGCGSPSGRRSEGSAPATEQSQPIGPSKTVAQAAPDGSITGMPVDVEFTHFASPSGNIACVVTSSGDSELVARGVRCDIDKRDWSPPPRPADCELDYGHGVVLGVGEAAEILCAGDTTIGRDGEPLAYGDAITTGLLRCESAQSGITCRDVESGHGFSISREAYHLF